MLKIGEIRELIRLLDETHLVELRIETDDMKLLLRKPSFAGEEGAVVTDGVTHAKRLTESYAASSRTDVFPAPTVSSAGGASALQDVVKDEDNAVVINSPMVGTFYRASAPDAPPFVEIGSRVTDKTVVCIVEAMKLMNEIEAEVQGEVVAILAENGQLVEYGQPLFKIKQV
ncbi:acetyl-CoA carboxylase biotin carboxyl carrier protein [Alicyclobacillaceae bacterium I2511]|nr:acetyl-CoA carboxylase biotin carboxyl carrier protein [Alicyclobacillaceae bacterium I2511]